MGLLAIDLGAQGSPPPSTSKLTRFFRSRNIRAIAIYLVLCCIVYILVVLLFNFQTFQPLANNRFDLRKSYRRRISNEAILGGIRGLGCKFPKLDPFDMTIQEFIQKPEPVDCSKKFPMLFKTDLDTYLIQVQSPSKYQFRNCCYREFGKINGSKEEFNWSQSCVKIVEQVTKIPETVHQFTIECVPKNSSHAHSKIIDAHGFIRPLRSPKPQRASTALEDAPMPSGNNQKLSVIVFGLDGLSHMNFIRTFPSTYKFITENLSAVGMQGYGKVGDNTFPNMVPVLTGLSEAQLQQSCWKSTEDFFDQCPMIWHNFSQNQYLTGYGESVPRLGIFEFNKRGFNKQPTDYYHSTLTALQDKEIGHNQPLNLNICIGPRMIFQEMLQIMKKMALAAKKASRHYFHLIWTASLTHDYLNDGLLGDGFLLETLKWFQTGDHLNNTVLILMSDHGIRWGQIHETYQGKVEERMPLLYFILPDCFKSKYTHAVENLNENSQVLTTPYDLHETLQDLASMDISNDDIWRRQTALNEAERLPRGISLFLNIPLSRACKDAEIDDHWCTCRPGKSIRPDTSSLAKEASAHALASVNRLLRDHKECAKLELESVLNAQLSSAANGKDMMAQSMDLISQADDERLHTQDLTLAVTFKVKPSTAVFDATATRYVNGTWKISGDVSRTNLYGNQSACVSDYRLKSYCYCI